MNTGTSFRRVLALFFCLTAASPVTAVSSQRICTLSITGTGGNVVHLLAEIADTDTLRSRGLMFRKGLDKNRGMIFMYSSEEYLTFWMKNTYIPLSIAYISGEGVIHEIYDMKPLDTSIVYPSRLPARYALEVNRGWFREHGITQGCRVNLYGCFGK